MKIKRIISLLLTLLILGSIFTASVLASDDEETVEDNRMAVFTFLTEEMELNAAAACGVMANIEYESGFDPTACGDGGASYGLCQWYNGRCEALRRFCEENGYDVDSIEGQLEYLNYELSNSYPSVLEYLRNVEDSPSGAYDAAWYWCMYFEIPADREHQAAQRGSLAEGEYYPQYSQSAI